MSAASADPRRAALTAALVAHGGWRVQCGTTARPYMCACGETVHALDAWIAHQSDAVLAAIDAALSGEDPR